MGLESASFIPELVPTNPLGSDPKSEGDNHLRLTKTAVQGSFPGFVGTVGTPKSVTKTEDQINDLAEKSTTNIFTAQQNFEATVLLANNIALQGRDVGDTTNVQFVSIDGFDIVIFGEATHDSEQHALAEHSIEIAGGEVGKWVTSLLGSLLVDDRQGVQKIAGFRGANILVHADVTRALDQNDEESYLQNSVACDYTIATGLELGTTFILSTRLATATVANTGITLIHMDGVGGVVVPAQIALTLGSILTLVNVATDIYEAYGNGIVVT